MAEAQPPIHQVGDHWSAWNPPQAHENAGVYVIEAGDTLWSLAERFYGDPFLWPQLWELNQYILDSRWIYPGDPLVVSFPEHATHADGVAGPPLDDLEEGELATGEASEPGLLRIVDVFYGTDRARNVRATGPQDFYTGGRGELELGICQVNIPRDHREGELEEPKWYRLEVQWNPERHVMVLGMQVHDEGKWLANLRTRIAESPDEAAFVFVHGYNVTFNDAARRAGQMAYDLKFRGAPILYSWPSQGTLAGYPTDETNVKRTVRYLKEFLELVTRQSGAKVVHLIAHSMGSRALTDALRQLEADETDAPIFNQIALVAPDIDAEIFKKDIMPAIRDHGRRVTLYASDKDKALEASRTFHGFSRAGDLKEAVLIAPGLDTIDASDVDTDFLAHSHFADASVIADLIGLFGSGKAPEEREGLRQMTHDDGLYWKIKP